ncbi:hypothetical protein M3Y96_00800200 [Aphelenchoides besseyi]|nr:hypothetical protein M3Y96_00800200 [Aphelenchoides besseyi]
MTDLFLTRSFCVLLIISLISTTKAKEFQFCPNEGEPKLDVNGKPIQCLPGQPSEGICGKGYACFFSGFNYQCCPSNEDKEHDEVQSECPDYAVAVLDFNGNPIRCSSLSDSCSQPNTYCNENNAMPICCQRLTPQSTPIAKEKQPQEIEKFFNSEDISNEPTTTSSAKASSESSTLECPGQSLMVLTDEGNPKQCNESSECPQKGMFCYGDTQKICCESIDFAVSSFPSNHTVETETGKSSEILTTITDSQSSVPSASTNETDASTLAPTPVHQLAESSYKQPIKELKISGKQLISKALASKNAEFRKPLEYQPHNSGGYAISRPFDAKDPGRLEKKEIVQQYLLEQIKQGWPYDEKFYRSENVGVVRDRPNPSAVVHFP